MPPTVEIEVTDWLTVVKTRARRCLFAAGAAATICVAPSFAQTGTQIRVTPMSGVGTLSRPVVGTVIVTGVHAPTIAANADGSFVSDIDGKRRNFGFRPGSIHSVRGRGFGRRSSASTILLRSDDRRYAATLAITRWDDDLIVAQVPGGQAGFPSADALTLVIMTGAGNGGPRQFVITGGRFTAEEAEVPLFLTANDRDALRSAGLRTRVWNVGREFDSFERDGAVSMTRYIDYSKDQRTTPCPPGGAERIDPTKLERALGLRGDFRISRINLSYPSATDGRPVGLYADAWQKIDGRDVYLVEWGVWRFRQDASFSISMPFRSWMGKFGRHGATEREVTDIYAACASEFTLHFHVTGPRGLRPR